MAEEMVLLSVDRETGALVVDDETSLGRAVQATLDGTLPKGERMGCAKPIRKLQLPAAPGGPLRIAGYWHDSLVDGPGRRSVVQFQGCPIRCPGCWVPETHAMDSGVPVHIDQVADVLLDPAHERNGVTIIGGEPFAQPVALDTLIRALRRRQPDLHITVYSGYKLSQLTRKIKFAAFNPIEGAILESIDLLIDGPYNRQLAHNDACECDDETRRFTGSCNQHVRRLR